MACTHAQVATLRSAVRLEQEQQFLIAKKLQELTGSKNIKLKPVRQAFPAPQFTGLGMHSTPQPPWLACSAAYLQQPQPCSRQRTGVGTGCCGDARRM